MRILFVSEYYPPLVMGGGEINLAQTTQALAKEGMEVAVLTSWQPFLPKEEVHEGVHIYRRLKTGKSPASLLSNLKRMTLFPLSLIKEVKNLDKTFYPEIIHLQGNAVIAAANLKKLGRSVFATVESFPALCPKGDRLYHGKEECKTVCSFRKFIPCQYLSEDIGKVKNTWYLKYNLPLLFLTYLHYKKLQHALRFCHVVSMSYYLKDLLAQHNLNTSAVIHNSIPSEVYSLKKKKTRKEKNETFNVLYLGLLSKAKGPQLLLEAVRTIRDFSCHIAFYGNGPLKEELLEKIYAEKINAEIHDPVPYKKIAELFSGADLVVYPSLWPEPFGRIPLEARIAGLPVIASAIGALPEMLNAGVKLVPPGNVQELQKAIEEVALQREKEKKIQKRKQQILPLAYTLPFVTRQWKNLYEMTVKQC